MALRTLGSVGAAALVGGAVTAMGPAPAMAQVTSSIKFDYTAAPNVTSLNSTNPASAGNLTYVGTGVGPATPPPTGSPFDGVTGIQFVNPFTYSYTATGSTASYTSFSPFWLIGTCTICQGQTGQQQITVPDSTGTILTQNIPGVATAVTLSGGPVPIRFGQNGSPGILVFDSLNLIAASNTIGEGTGTITISMLQDTTGVPGPLPILGASTAFAFSRRLRRRVSLARATD